MFYVLRLEGGENIEKEVWCQICKYWYQKLRKLYNGHVTFFLKYENYISFKVDSELKNDISNELSAIYSKYTNSMIV